MCCMQQQHVMYIWERHICPAVCFVGRGETDWQMFAVSSVHDIWDGTLVMVKIWDQPHCHQIPSAVCSCCP